MKTVLLLALTVTTVASALEDAKCTLGTQERRVEVSFSDAEKKVPCEVKYTKDAEEPKVLWNAQNDAEYCSTKAQGLVDKLTGSGWNCGGAAAAKATSDDSQESSEKATGETEESPSED